MQYLKCLVFLSIGGLAVPAFATDPPAPPAPAPGVSSDAAAAKARQDALDQQAHAMGYRSEVHNGVTVWCKKETPIGSRFEKKVCSSSEEIARIANDAQNQGLQPQH